MRYPCFPSRSFANSRRAGKSLKSLKVLEAALLEVIGSLVPMQACGLIGMSLAAGGRVTGSFVAGGHVIRGHWVIGSLAMDRRVAKHHQRECPELCYCTQA
jgi:hypothetical protein